MSTAAATRLPFAGLGWTGRHLLDAIVRSGDADGIVIATPSAMHAEQAIAALERGKAVFCQKPLGRASGAGGGTSRV